MRGEEKGFDCASDVANVTFQIDVLIVNTKDKIEFWIFFTVPEIKLPSVSIKN